ncbi:hypothetical protein [Rhizobium pisi]|uniref:hypothetical protein n=1 Tax=Rhizobium pisi TaxID=574561 RepID=UPI003D058B91
MVETSATPASIAARHSATEQVVQWLLNNRGNGGDEETTQQLQRLFKMLVTGAVASGLWNAEEPWEDTLLYEGADKSLHLTLFGATPANAIACQDGKGLYGRIFSDSESRWNGSGSTFNRSLATDTYGATNAGYIEALRTANRSLAQAVFKSAANAGGKTIIDRIADVQTDVDTLADNIETTTNSLQAQIDQINARIDDLESRMNSG